MLDMDTGNNTVPGFLLKLWTLVEDPSSDHLISWSENGSSFIIHDQAQFAKDLLPLYFKHSNTASFIRQLNMYGFRKVFSLEQGRLKSEATSLEFQHPYFLMGNENLLEMIKRKAPVPKDDITRCRSEVLSQVVTDLNLIKQENEELKANLVKRNHENDVVWRELANLKQKYQNHQQMLNKLLHFLVNLVPGNRGMNRSVKRKLPLMIENSLPEKVSRSNLDSIADNLVLTDGSTDDGPVIRDITDFVDPNSPSNRLANSLELNENSRTNISSAPSHLSMDSQLGIQPSGFDPSDILSGISANLGMENSECGRDVNDHSYSQTSKLGSNPSDISISSSKKKSMVNDSEIRNKSLIIQPVTDNLNSGSRKNAVISSSFPNVKGNISTSSKDILSPPSADLNIHSDLGIQSSVFDPVGSNAETNDILNGITENLGIKDFDNSQYGNNHAYAQSDLTKFASSTSKDKGDMSVAIPDAPSLHIPEDNGLKGLDWLKNQLMTSGGYSIDPGYLLDLLSHSDARKSNIKPIDEKINSNEVQGNELVSRLSPSPDLSLFDVESTISSSNDLDFDLDAILGISDQINNANTLNTPEVTDKILNFDQPKDVSKNEKVSKKGKTYSKKKVK